MKRNARDLLKLCVVGWAFALASLVACPPPAPPSPPTPDADADAPSVAVVVGDAIDDSTVVPAGVVPACASLKANACPEGKDPSCVGVLARAVNAHLASFNLPCLVTAKSQSEVRACGPAVPCAAK